MIKSARQTTLRDHVAVFGVGVHSGLAATLTLHPADADTGIIFLRTATADRPEREIRADVRAVTATEFATVLGDSSGPLCSTAAHGFRVEAEIEFPSEAIGRQAIALDIEPGTFRRELARARTFGFMRDVAKLWSSGYALGASFENTLVITDDRILNPAGLRYPDEFVRHKVLDAIGDLALAGAPLLGLYRSHRGGHRLNYAVLSTLMADPSAWRLIDLPAPARRARGRADVGAGLVAPAYSPEVS
jgi:UDP-3-O-[3-hydroxymyristoyl] N-acetylglucosamine deacetylase